MDCTKDIASKHPIRTFSDIALRGVVQQTKRNETTLSLCNTMQYLSSPEGGNLVALYTAVALVASTYDVIANGRQRRKQLSYH